LAEPNGNEIHIRKENNGSALFIAVPFMGRIKTKRLLALAKFTIHHSPFTIHHSPNSPITISYSSHK
jgi:hypothetical protein